MGFLTTIRWFSNRKRKIKHISVKSLVTSRLQWSMLSPEIKLSTNGRIDEWREYSIICGKQWNILINVNPNKLVFIFALEMYFVLVVFLVLIVLLRSEFYIFKCSIFFFFSFLLPFSFQFAFKWDYHSVWRIFGEHSVHRTHTHTHGMPNCSN